jgi:hypothetical protein
MPKVTEALVSNLPGKSIGNQIRKTFFNANLADFAELSHRLNKFVLWI